MGVAPDAGFAPNSYVSDRLTPLRLGSGEAELAASAAVAGLRSDRPAGEGGRLPARRTRSWCFGRRFCCAEDRLNRHFPTARRGYEVYVATQILTQSTHIYPAGGSENVADVNHRRANNLFLHPPAVSAPAFAARQVRRLGRLGYIDRCVGPRPVARAAPLISVVCNKVRAPCQSAISQKYSPFGSPKARPSSSCAARRIEMAHVGALWLLVVALPAFRHGERMDLFIRPTASW